MNKLKIFNKAYDKAVKRITLTSTEYMVLLEVVYKNQAKREFRKTGRIIIGYKDGPCGAKEVIYA